ncbi:Cytochrome P450 family 71 protein [Rhynchospora pubera]|uniref:Cytochrome P450 family 71 protein n=1 Tax=Rhynchospora pubera TaxID=906938 RepID=A0AAV8FHV5_9POAL|nr:Cytochrome P450 family 71 protein [Rhynchospora pubera]
MAREIMKVHDATFATRNPTVTVKILSYNGKDIAFAPYGDYWRQVRKICILELLSLKRVQSFRSIREEETANLVESISSLSGDGKLINLSDKIFSTINDLSVRAVVGDKCKNQDIFLRELQKGFGLASGFNLVDLFPSSYLVSLISRAAREATRCHQELDRLLDDMIEEHSNRKAGADEVEDLLGVVNAFQGRAGLPGGRV